MNQKTILLLRVAGLLLATFGVVGGRATTDAPGAAAGPQLPPSSWELKEGAPPAVAAVLERMKQQRQREFDAQVRLIERGEEDLAARKAGRVVKELKAPEGWRSVPGRSGRVEYAFKTPQIKGHEVVKAEAALEHARRRLGEISHPAYLARPVLRAAELKEGAAGTVPLRVLHQVDGSEGVVRAEDEPTPAAAPGRVRPKPAGVDLYLSDYPARDYGPGRVVTDWTIEVVGSKTYQGENGRMKTALHAKPLDWRKWVQIVPVNRP